jgi:hypothetical protein
MIIIIIEEKMRIIEDLREEIEIINNFIKI